LKSDTSWFYKMCGENSLARPVGAVSFAVKIFPYSRGITRNTQKALFVFWITGLFNP